MREYGILNLFMRPEVATLCIIIFITGYLIYIDKEGGFKDGFLEFGPSDKGKFIGMKIDSWVKVIVLYIIGFITGFVKTYYSQSVYIGIDMYLQNHLAIDMPSNKKWTYIIVLFDPIIQNLFTIITFFTTLTMQLQFILPMFIGNRLASIPFTLKRLALKKFSS